MINDLACHSIESGDYQVALDVLNTCLGCVKQLKRFRGQKSSNTTESTGCQKAVEESVSRLLKGAKQKLLSRISNPSLIINQKRKRSNPLIRQRKRRRRHLQNEQEFHSSSIESSNATSSEPLLVDPSQQSMCSPSVPNNPVVVPSTDVRCSTHGHPPSCSCQNQETEDRYFVYRKPLRLTKFQWTRITKCDYSDDLEQDEKNQQQTAREVELAISANLIFNIALSHHLLASTTRKELLRNTRYNAGLSPDSGDDTDGEDEENGFDTYSFDSHGVHLENSLQTKQRLKGALRLYELGFRVHTKRVGLVMSLKTRSFRRRVLNSTASLPSISAVLPSLSSSFSTIPSVRRVSLSPSDEVPSQEEGEDREDELKSATRFALALLNNCAQIHEALGQLDKAKIFQKRLLSFLLVIVDSGESIREIVGDDPAVDGYLKNVLARTVFDKKTAPAAMA